MSALRASDADLRAAREASVYEVALRCGARLKKTGGADYAGPCPLCGGTDRFSINTQKNVFHCRKCDVGGDAIALWAHITGDDFPRAVAGVLNRALEAELSPEARAAADERAATAAKQRALDEAAAAKKAEAARAKLYKIWKSGRDNGREYIARYLSLRGITAPDARLRCIPDYPYYHGVDATGAPKIIHRGVAMIAALRGGDEKFSGLHVTWFDLNHPRGKISLLDDVGAPLPRKKIFGRAGGCRIELITTKPAHTLIMGEGIETTLSVYTAMVAAGRDVSGVNYWAAGSLDNMGRREGAAGFSLSDNISTLILLQDGDSDPAKTRATLERGAARYAFKSDGTPRLVKIAPAPQGADFNDILGGCDE